MARPENDKASSMLTTENPFDPKAILDGIRRWVEIETPTEAPEEINRLATMVADGYRDLPATSSASPDTPAAAINRGTLVMGPGAPGILC